MARSLNDAISNASNASNALLLLVHKVFRNEIVFLSVVEIIVFSTRVVFTTEDLTAYCIFITLITFLFVTSVND